MNDSLKKGLTAAIGVLFAALLGFFGFSMASNPESGLGSGQLTQLSYPAAIGTATSPVTLATTTYSNASSSVILAGGLPHLVLAGTYTPKSYGSVMYLKLERSIDNGTTFFPYDVISPGVSGTLVYNAGTSTTPGAPFVIPGEGIGTAASGTAIGFSFDLPAVADYIRVSAKEYSTSTRGTVNVQVILQSN